MKKITYILFALLNFKAVISQNITTIAGVAGLQNNSCSGSSIANTTKIGQPSSICIDISGNVYFSDSYLHCIRKINQTTGLIQEFGNYSGTNPQGICVDKNKNVYIADLGTNKVYKIDSLGNNSTFAGTGTYGYSGDYGLATNADLRDVVAVCSDNDSNVYIAMYRCIRKVNISTNIITTIAGDPFGLYSFMGDGGLATIAKLVPSGVAVDAARNIYISDQSAHRIRKVDYQTNIINTIAGTGTLGYSGDGGNALNANIYPLSIFVDANNNILYSDGGGGVGTTRIRKIESTTNLISTIIGTLTACTQDGFPAQTACINAVSICSDHIGNMYVADAGSNHRIRKVVVNTLGLKDNFEDEIYVKYYPNPNNGYFTIDSEQETNITLTNVLGEIILTQKIQQGVNTINIDSRTCGMYFINIENSTFKIIKQ